MYSLLWLLTKLSDIGAADALPLDPDVSAVAAAAGPRTVHTANAVITEIRPMRMMSLR